MPNRWINSYNNVTIEKREGRAWIEYHNGNSIYDFQLVSQNGSHVILFDPERSIYLKLTNEDLKWGLSRDDINWFLANGKWEIHDGINIKRIIIYI